MIFNASILDKLKKTHKNSKKAMEKRKKKKKVLKRDKLYSTKHISTYCVILLPSLSLFSF